jgi:hypothetical protein
MSPAAAGLCDRCAHRRLVTTRRSTFVLCRLSRTDPRFVRYPTLPVRACAGHVPRATGPALTPPVVVVRR